jgi:diketogulonate reductase-like aldo/keto reductase
MSLDSLHSRREFLALLGAAGASAAAPHGAWAQQAMPTRRIPSSGEALPVIGLGSSKPVAEIPTKGTDPIAAILRSLVEHGGRVVDTWPRNTANDAALGRVINQPDLREKLFVTTKVSAAGPTGVAQLEESLRSYGRKTIDLAQVFSMVDVEAHWPKLREWQSTGRARYTGVTVSEYGLYDQLEKFLRREKPDFVQLNYSITERRAEERLLPLAQERGVAVLVNRPFMNGEYFKRLSNKPLPTWAAEIGIQSWAEFSLKYILPHPAVTCVLTETSNPEHMAANAKAAHGTMPDAAVRRRMAAYIDQV